MIPTPLLPRLQPFRPFAERLGVDPDVLRRDDACPSIVTIGGVEHADLEALARFEVTLLIRAWGEECETHRAKVERRRATDTARATAAVAHAAEPASASSRERSEREPEPITA